MATEMKRTRSGRFTSESETPDPLSDPIEEGSVPPGEVGEDDDWLSEDEGTVKNKGGKGKGKAKAKTPTTKQKAPAGWIKKEVEARTRSRKKVAYGGVLGTLPVPTGVDGAPEGPAG